MGEVSFLMVTKYYEVVIVSQPAIITATKNINQTISNEHDQLTVIISHVIGL